jgi:hypothetical protein
MGHSAPWVSGTFTPTLTSSTATTRTLGQSLALRAAVDVPRVRRMSRRR